MNGGYTAFHVTQSILFGFSFRLTSSRTHTLARILFSRMSSMDRVLVEVYCEARRVLMQRWLIVMTSVMAAWFLLLITPIHSQTVCGPNNSDICEHNGICDPVTNQCTCVSQWTGVNCTQPYCVNPLCDHDGGVCVATSTNATDPNADYTFHCQCNPLWNGTDCGVPVCSSPCNNGGTCSRNHQCVCAPEWTGPTCDVPVCNPSCEHGTCVVSNIQRLFPNNNGALVVLKNITVCQCESGYYGDTCATSVEHCAPISDAEAEVWQRFQRYLVLCNAGYPYTCQNCLQAQFGINQYSLSADHQNDVTSVFRLFDQLNCWAKTLNYTYRIPNALASRDYYIKQLQNPLSGGGCKVPPLCMVDCNLHGDCLPNQPDTCVCDNGWTGVHCETCTDLSVCGSSDNNGPNNQKSGAFPLQTPAQETALFSLALAFLALLSFVDS